MENDENWIWTKSKEWKPENGRYISPINDEKPFEYNQRSLPYVEDIRQYHQYEVIGDFGNIQIPVGFLLELCLLR